MRNGLVEGRQPGVDHASQPVHHGFGGKGQGRYVGELFPDGTETADSDTELFALVGIAGGFGQGEFFLADA